MIQVSPPEATGLELQSRRTESVGKSRRFLNECIGNAEVSLGFLSRKSCRRKRCGDQNPPSHPALANCSLIFTEHVRCCLAWTHERTFCTTDSCSQSAVGEIDSGSKGSLNHTMIIPERKLGSTIYEMQKRSRGVSHIRSTFWNCWERSAKPMVTCLREGDSSHLRRSMFEISTLTALKPIAGRPFNWLSLSLYLFLLANSGFNRSSWLGPGSVS